MSSDLLALALRRDAGARDELALRLTSLRREAELEDAARIELEALLRELRDTVSPSMRRAIDMSLTEQARIDAVSNAARKRRRARLSEDELAELALKGDFSRLVALARRPDLSLRMSGMVAARGHLPALYALAGNRSATIGRSVLIALAELALGDPALCALLIRRNDLPEEAVSYLWPHLPDGDKAALLMAGAPYGEPELGEIADEDELHLHDTLRRGTLPVSVDALMDGLEDGSASPDDAIERLCKQARIVALAEFLARLLSCALLPCLNLLAMPSPRGAALLCRAGGLRRESYELVAKLRSEFGWQAPGGSSAGLEAFDTLSKSAAQRVFALYKAASRK
ncbi:MAG: DUF2336 domain-containing protein [Hyphomicrobiales bacterium]